VATPLKAIGPHRAPIVWTRLDALSQWHVTGEMKGKSIFSSEAAESLRIDMLVELDTSFLGTDVLKI
jgi:hypothetical protein